MLQAYIYFTIAWCSGFLATCDASVIYQPVAEIAGPWERWGLPSNGNQNRSNDSLKETLMIDPSEGCGLFVRIVEAADRAGRGVVEAAESAGREVVEAARRRRRYQAQSFHEIEEADFENQIAPEPDSMKFSSRCRGVGMSCLAGLSTAVGAAVVFLLPGGRASPAQMAFVLALAGGVMLSITVFEFWLPALTSSESSLIHVAVCSALGAACFLLMSRLMPEPQFASVDVEAPSDMYRDQAKAGVKSSRSNHLAAVLLMSLSVHNFPEGFAVAASSLSSQSSGFAVMLAIALHNIPEGIAIAVPVLEASGSRAKALWMTVLSGLAEPFGALLALLLVDTIGVETQKGVESILCMVGGVMLAVAAKELLPEGWSQGQPVPFAFGLLLGVALMLGTICLGA